MFWGNSDKIIIALKKCLVRNLRKNHVFHAIKITEIEFAYFFYELRYNNVINIENKQKKNKIIFCFRHYVSHSRSKSSSILN